MFEESSEIEFYGNNLWSYYDNIISNNYLAFDYYGFDKENKIHAPKFKLSIYGKTSNKDSKITFDSCELYKFSYQLKSEILKNIKEDVDKFKTDQKWSHGFSYNSFKKNIYVTVMWNDLSNSPVIRFMIGEKERTILESDKVYIPVIDFFSFSEILNQSFNNYINLCCISSLESNIVRLQKSTENLNINDANNNDSINHIFNNMSNFETLDSIKLSISGNQSDIPKVDIVTNNQSTVNVELAKVNAGKESVEQQESFDKFLMENRDSFELDLPETSQSLSEKKEKDPCKKSNLEESESKFIKNLCNNDFSVLEQVIFNCSNEILPFDSFVNVIKQATDIDFKDGISSADYNCLNYIISNNIKYNVNQLLEKKRKLPGSITPIIVKNEKIDNDKIDVMYYLLLFYIYLSKIKVVLAQKSNNSLDNKEYFSYIIKAISNPLVFSYFPEMSEDVIKSEVLKRYFKLKECNFFDKFTENVKSKITSVNNTNISETDITEDISKIYNSVLKFKDKLTIKSSFNASIMKVPYDVLNESNINIDTLAKLVHFDVSLCKYGKINDNIDLTCYDDVPVNILKLYGIKTVKFDSSIIIKYFTTTFKDFDDLEKIKKINKNVYDIIDDIDIAKYDTLQLRALYYWNVDLLPKDLTYLQFTNLIESSSLEKPELLSMILNRVSATDKTFYDSFLVSASDGTDV